MTSRTEADFAKIEAENEGLRKTNEAQLQVIIAQKAHISDLRTTLDIANRQAARQTANDSRPR